MKQTPIPTFPIQRLNLMSVTLAVGVFALVTKSPAATNVLFAIDDKQVWRYDASGEDLGTSWREKDFDDTRWPAGKALIGWENQKAAEPIRTQLPFPLSASKYVVTYYFRTHFNFAGNDTAGVQLILRHVIDDGAVFYLNGKEVHRFLMAPEGEVFAETIAAGLSENAYRGPFPISAASLIPGDNVFAVEVHQCCLDSSDIVFGAELLVSTTATTAPPPPLPQPSGGTLGTNILIAIDDTQMWRYDNSGSDLGTAWKEKGFDDSSWPQGAALLALETDGTTEPIRTTLTRQNAAVVGIMTDYFRTHFTFTGDLATTKLSLRHFVDDGFVLYLNGAEVYRFGIADGEVTATTAATSHEGRNIFEGPFDIPAAALVAGDNVLAAEVHQASATSSDIVFGLELKAIASSAPPSAAPRFAVVNRAVANLNLEWTGTGTLQSADAVTGPWTDMAAAKSPLTVPIVGNAKFYRLRQ